MVCLVYRMFKEAFYSFTSLGFVSEAASKADLYFPCKGGQMYCAGCLQRLVIYGSGKACRPLPCVPAAHPGPDEKQQARTLRAGKNQAAAAARTWHALWPRTAALLLCDTGSAPARLGACFLAPAVAQPPWL